MKGLFLFVSVVLCLGCTRTDMQPKTATCGRIVSLAPSITETLFELGLGSHLVGVTRYCSWPLEAAKIPKIGGWHDPSLEAILGVRPDTVFHLPEQSDIAEKLRAVDIATIALPAKELGDVAASARLIGGQCGVEKEADAFAISFDTALTQVAEKSAGKERPKVLVAVGRDRDATGIKGLFVAGKGSFHDELITRAGGLNACAVGIPYPRISAEGLLAMNPDIIIEFVSEDEAKNASTADWKGFDTVGAVKSGRVHIVTGDRSFIPGPRAPLLLEELVRLIHPDDVEVRP
ncbi:MAG TPA: helical backbone metal receptor [bacterium]|nr:helical backbone metal receptor [bacterium]